MCALIVLQVSRVIAENALTILEGLGLLSPEYGFLEYLHGHYPDSVNHKDQTFVIKFPAIEKVLHKSDSEEEPPVGTEATPEYVVSIPTGGSTSYLLCKTTEISNDADHTAKAALSSLAADYAESHELILLSVLRAVDGLKGSQKDRLRVVSLRVQCLLIVTHSRLSHELLHPYIKAGSTVLRDLISLSDISSESFSALQLEPSSLSAVNLILNCVLGILEFNLRRRGPLLAGILLELGLTRSGLSPCSSVITIVCLSVRLTLSVCSHYCSHVCLFITLSISVFIFIFIFESVFLCGGYFLILCTVLLYLIVFLFYYDFYLVVIN